MTERDNVRPIPHRLIYGVFLLGFIVAAGLILWSLTARVTRAEEDTAQAVAAAQRLSEQVQRLGGTPVVDPENLPEPVPGEPGAQGVAGIPGATGPIGPRGPIGPVGPAGPRGRPGADGEDGVSIAGTDGATGPVGPAGPEGPQGPSGKDGQDGKDGADGQPGAPGPTCPDGYSPQERTVFTSESPNGERILVCVAGQAAP